MVSTNGRQKTVAQVLVVQGDQLLHMKGYHFFEDLV